MSPRPARFTKAEIRRFIAVAKEEGFARIEIFPSGKIVLENAPAKSTADESNEWDAVQ